MKKHQLLIGLILLVFGLGGVLSMLTMEIPIAEESMALLLQQFSPEQIRYLILLNPAIILVVGCIVGLLLYTKVKLKVPVAEGIVKRRMPANLLSILKTALLGGIITGVLLVLIGLIFGNILPEEFLELAEKMKPTLAARFLYGGFTEEIMLRFGLMTFLVWLISIIFKSLKPAVYWAAILISAFVFAVSHFPVTFQAVENPSFVLLSYVILGNSIGGIVFGWFYWKKGLESAFIAHICAHVVLVLSELVI